MLKEYLPKLKEKFLKKFPTKAQQEQADLQKGNLSPNLLLPIETKNLFVKAAPAIVKTTNYVVIFVSAVFLILLFLNFIVDRQLRTLSKGRDNLIIQIEMNSHIEDRAREISSQIDLYKAKKMENFTISEGLEFVIFHIINYVKLENLAYAREDNHYTVDARANTPTSFAFMINGLLSEDYVDSIVIKTVQLVRGEREYLAHFEVKMK